MKENVTLTALNKYTKIMLVFMLLTLISVGPSLFLPGNWRLALPLIFWIASMYGAIKVEGLKKQENIKTYKEIVAFMENKEVAPLRKQRNKVRNRIEKSRHRHFVWTHLWSDRFPRKSAVYTS